MKRSFLSMLLAALLGAGVAAVVAVAISGGGKSAPAMTASRVNASTPSGDYSGSFTVTVAYN